MGRGEISPPSDGEIGNFGKGRGFFMGWWKSVEKWFWLFKPFSKLKTIFCKNWTLIKLKLSWPVCTKVWSYEKCTGATTTAKIEGFIGLQNGNCYLEGAIKIWWGEWTNFQSKGVKVGSSW